MPYPTRAARSARAGRSAAVLALAVLACAPAPVDWTSARTTTMPAATQFVLAADGGVYNDSLSALAGRVSPPAQPLCPGSLRLARAGGILYAVWWSPRADSSARLLSARSVDAGRTWGPPAPVDTVDQGVNGCRREPAAIAADSASGYVHVTYGLQAPEGPGLFFSHSMDSGVTFHAPVPILYGERLGRTSVAADGDLVVVGFEDPNSSTPRIGFAMSRTMGHIFEERVVPVSDDHGVASRPVAAVRGRHVALAWEQRASATAPAVLSVRAGTVH